MTPLHQTVEYASRLGRRQGSTVGEMKYTNARFNICSMLVFPHVRATRTSKAIWVVTTDGASDVTVCAGGSPQNMPFSLEIRLR